MNYTEEDLRNAVSNAFDYYDEKRMGRLEFDQVEEMINDNLRHMGSTRSLGPLEIIQFMQKTDLNFKDKVASRKCLKFSRFFWIKCEKETLKSDSLLLYLRKYV